MRTSRFIIAATVACYLVLALALGLSNYADSYASAADMAGCSGAQS